MADLEQETLGVMECWEKCQEALKLYLSRPTSERRIQKVKKTSDIMSEAVDACVATGSHSSLMFMHMAQLSETAHGIQGRQADKASEVFSTFSAQSGVLLANLARTDPVPAMVSRE